MISLADKRPDLVKYWSPNNEDKPSDVSHGSAKIRLWVCDIGHETPCPVYSKNLSNVLCPVCSNKLVLKGFNDLATTDPEVASHILGVVKYEVTRSSHKKVQAICAHGHVWTSVVYNLVKQGVLCSVCANKTILVGFNNLGHTHPDVTSELVDKGYGNSLSYGSNKSVEWACVNGCVYLREVYSRTVEGFGCPDCETVVSKPEVLLRTGLASLLGIDVNPKTLRIPWGSSKIIKVDALLRYQSQDYIIEYDGEYWHQNLVGNDSLKSRALLDAGYCLIRIRESRKGLLHPLNIVDLRYNEIPYTPAYTYRNMSQLIQKTLDTIKKGEVR